ncbi:excalibur calcium-binding domain-containing protein [Sphingorhabdus sp.]|uniref:excalibur calcium-binding domain-containing protein n=1 Tax=Sphingorhabdus sp. TaxID=1902408 RepID=UPI003918DC07
MARDSFLKTAAPLVVLTFLAVYNFPMSKEERAAAGLPDPPVFYRYCSDVRAAGKAPLHHGEPGYMAHLDRDNDGIACESY